MSWKVFIIACVSAAAVSFPQNIIGCGGETDPYDYYTSFFHPDLPAAKGYKPFYYTGYNFLYDDIEPQSTSDVFAKEWATYCGTSVTEADAKKFVNKFAWKDLNNLYLNLEKNQPLKLPDSVKRNSMTDYFINNKNLETLGYIMYAKQVEPFVTDVDYWNAPARDSLKMGKLIKNGSQLLNVAKQDFIKLRYIYQIMRLAHYSGRYPEVIEWYDKTTVFPDNISVIKNLCLALKAGALFRTGQQKEAAYLFSKSFSGSVAKRISNYLGFKWSVDSKAAREDYLQLCKNNTEKASMLALFSMGTASLELSALKDIYKLNPTCEELEVLVVREVNKLEETYFTPALQQQKGGKPFYLSWNDSNSDSIFNAAGKHVKGYIQFFHEAAQNNKVTNPALFETSAAYVAFMAKDYKTAKKYLANVDKMNASQKVKDQCALTSLLITINETDKIDAAFEEAILPSIQWLEQKAKTETPAQIGYWDVYQWKTFYRSLMSEILARRYHEQGDLAKETLAIGAADWIMKGKSVDGYNFTSGNGLDFLRNSLESKDVEQLFTLMDSKQQNKFEQYLINHNEVKKSAVVDFAGTAYLREYNYAKAIEWFKRSTDKKVINKNPFFDLLFDQDAPLPGEKITTTKLQFAEEMLRLEQQAMVSKPAAQQYYKMAVGLYNMTYYGHAWELVKYYRSGSDGYNIPKNATAFEKEYYGCYKAKEYFETAMNMSNDKNFKARCLFMMAKCSQKQIHQPQYTDYTGENYWDKMDADTKVYTTAFMNNQYFPQLVKEYGNTPFYKEAFNSCSYLRDFVKKR